MNGIQRYDKLFIGGKWTEPANGKRFETYNPATGEVWAEVAEGTETDIDRAGQAARKAFETGDWPKMTATQRGRLLRKLGDLILQHADELARLETTDNGKAIRETRDIELPAIAEWYYYYAGMADKIQGDYIPIDDNVFSYTVREPIGVVGAIIPWNSPLLMAAWKLAPALAAGNTVILKPAEQTSVTALELAKLIDAAGFPPGVVNVVPGFGSTAGAAISAHPDIDKVAFTGEHTTAQAITTASAVNLKKLSFELGGKSPHIVFADADLDQALIAAVSGIYVAGGQTCAAGSRLFLQDTIYDEFVEKFVRMTKQIRVGNPMLTETQMGAQTSLEQLEKIEKYVQLGRQSGAELLFGGHRPDDLKKGYFFTPTVFANVKNEMRIAQEEIFGPVVSILSFHDEEEAVRLANDVKYGLTAGVWTRDIRKGHLVAKRLKAGMVWVNNYRRFHWCVPYGGNKMSGYGRENGLEVIHLYTQVKSIMVDLAEERKNPYER